MNKEIFKLVSQIPGWLTKHEGQSLEKAAKVLKSHKGVIVEIGSYCGKSTIWLAQAGETVYAVDPHKGEFSGGKTKPTRLIFLQNLKRTGVSKNVIPIIMTSKEAAFKWNKPIKFLFIDGLHDYDHAMEDFSLWNPYILKGGFVAMHDAFCGWQGAGDVAMRQIVYSPDFGEIGVVGSILYGIKGSASMSKRVIKLCNQLVIELSSAIYKSSFLPKWVQFLLVHKFLRIFLINRFTSLGYLP